MSLKRKFVVPINLILVGVLAASLAWEWRRQRGDRDGSAARPARRGGPLRPGGVSRLRPHAPLRRDFCGASAIASDPGASPEHQVALVDDDGRVIAARRGPRPASARPGRPGRARRRLLATGRPAVRSSWSGWRPTAAAGWWSPSRPPASAAGSAPTSGAMPPGTSGSAASCCSTVNGVMRRAVLRPIRRLGRAVTQMERGRLGVQVELPEDDELGTLAGRFNAMSGALAGARRGQPPRDGDGPPGPVAPAAAAAAAARLPGGRRPVSSRPARRRRPARRACPLPGDRVGVLVADLSGHNVAAALHTAMVRAIVRREAEQAASPGEVLARLNDQLVRDLPDEHFATAFLGWFDPHAGRLDYANAGHPPAALREPDGRVHRAGRRPARCSASCPRSPPPGPPSTSSRGPCCWPSPTA